MNIILVRCIQYYLVSSISEMQKRKYSDRQKIYTLRNKSEPSADTFTVTIAEPALGIAS